MSSVHILPGQYYITEPGDDERRCGWTIKAVLAGTVDEVSKERGHTIVWAIRNDVRTAAPQPFPYHEIRHLVDEGLWKVAQGPVKPVVRLDSLTAEEVKKVKSGQEARLALIQPLIELGEDAFWTHVRRPALKHRASETKKTPDHLWQLLCLYWQFGGPDGLRPRCFLAGQKSLKKRVEEATRAAKAARDADPKSKATGADFFTVYKTGRKRADNVVEGKPMEWADIQTCRRGARKFLHVRSSDNKLRYNYANAYTSTLDELYGWNEAQAHVMEVPSLDQFIAAVKSDPDFEKLSTRIVGPMAAARDHRPKKGTTQYEVLGPGHVLQVDDVSGKVILLHENTLLPIGVGNIFAGTDQWSKAIAGGALTLEGSSFEGVKELFVNVATPKADFFKEQGIAADPKFFPHHGVWRYVCADKGPLGADLGNIVARKLCDLMNPASHRPDLKSDIESSFHAYLRQHAEKLPGYNRVERRSGNEDPDVIACLTPREFMRLWWEWAAIYNARELDSYLPFEAIRLPEHLRPTNRPFDLFRWGLNEVTACLRQEPEEEIRRALLREADGTLTPRNGIKLFKLRYFLDGTQPIRIKSVKVKIYHSALYLKRIWVLLDGEWLTASLNEEDARKLGHLTMHEMRQEKEHRETSARGGNSQRLIMRVEAARSRRKGVKESRANVQSRYPDEEVRRLLVSRTPRGLSRNSAVRLERQRTAAQEGKAFPAPNHDSGRPQSPLKRMSRSELAKKS